jgi:hypothetical protein
MGGKYKTTVHTNVYVRLRPLENGGVCAVDVVGAGGGLLVDGKLERVGG